MLILSRKLGEDIYIGNEIRLVVLEHSSTGEVRLGIEGPRNILILRGELLNRSRPQGRGVARTRRPSERPHPR